MRRILFKISGEAFSGDIWAIDMSSAKKVWEFIEYFYREWYEIAIVVWWWNIYRGSKLIAAWMRPSDSHSMSMLSTVFNAVTLKNILQELKISCVVLDALQVEFLEAYTSEKWKTYLSNRHIVICSSWTWNPFFTTDTAWVLRALELECDGVIKLTKVDGVYNKDPLIHSDAIHYPEISYDDFIAQNLQIFDTTWIILARDNHLPVFVSKLDDRQASSDILEGRVAGTKIF